MKKTSRSPLSDSPAASAHAEASGRINLIGEHTDYNGGLVLPMLIPQKTTVDARPRGDSRVIVWSREMRNLNPFEYELGREAPQRSWADYVQGVTKLLIEEGHRLGGCELRVASDVPLGSGLSSSAALEVAALRALRQLFDLPLDDVRIAQIGQRVENEFVGARVGIMDQMVCSLGQEGRALFLDTRTLRYEHIPLPAGCEIGVIHSGVLHQHASGGYNTRRDECHRAADLLEVELLSDLSLDDLPRLENLPDPLRRRARHVITENARVHDAVSAMADNDPQKLGTLFVQSHVSMRDDYEVSVPEIDFLVDAACKESGVHGARLTGGGFGGSMILLAREGAALPAARRVAQAYQEQFQIKPAVLLPIGKT